jgi:hypothetical protein
MTDDRSLTGTGTYMMFSLRKPPYFSSRARGVSQWKMVTNGLSPGDENEVLLNVIG